jgi:two-component system cell cycle sensor histidine kinase PleC
MSPAEVKVALEPFAQVHSVMINKHNGTGLGLSLVKTFMDLHGGKFEIESEHGKGTCARRTIPQERAGSAAAAE